MPLTIYGSPRSRTMRVLWMATELQLDFEHVPYEFDDSALKQPAFLALNPAGAIPTIVDDGFAQSESLAINLYLAKKYGSDGPESLYPAGLQAESKVLQWCLWVQGDLEPWLQKDAILAELIADVAHRRDPIIHRSLSLLDAVVANAGWLVAGRFTVADLNVAAVLSPSRIRTLDLSPYPHVSDWLQRCYSRPAAIAARARYQV
jgi:glutathione S-transferase